MAVLEGVEGIPVLFVAWDQPDVFRLGTGFEFQTLVRNCLKCQRKYCFLQLNTTLALSEWLTTFYLETPYASVADVCICICSCGGGKKCLSVLGGFLLQARVVREYSWGRLGWVQLRFSCQQQTPHGLSKSQLSLAVTRPVGSTPREPVLAHLGVLQVWKGSPVAGSRPCGTTGEGKEIRRWLPAIHQPRNKENF